MKIRKLLMGLIVAPLTITGLAVSQAPAQADDSAPTANKTDSTKVDRSEAVKVERKIANMTKEVQQRAGEGAVCTPTTETVDGVQYNYTTCVEASSEASSTATAKGKAKVTADGRLILSFISPNGLPKGQREGCERHNVGERFLTDYYNSLGQRVWKWKTVQPGDQFCFDGAGTLRDTECNNQAKFNPPPKLRKKAFKGKVKIVKKQKLGGRAVAKTSGKSHSGVVAVQQTGACAGSTASGSGTATYFARAESRFWAWSMAKLKAMLEAEEGKLEIQEEQRARGEVSATAKGKAQTSAYGNIVCNAPPPTHDECIEIPGNQPEGYDCTGPKGVIVGPLHLYEHGTATYRVRGWDNTDGSNVDIDVWFTGNCTGSYVGSYVDNGQKVVEYIIVAGPNNGTNDDCFMHARVTDQDGLVNELDPHRIYVEANDTGE